MGEPSFASRARKRFRKTAHSSTISEQPTMHQDSSCRTNLFETAQTTVISTRTKSRYSHQNDLLNSNDFDKAENESHSTREGRSKTVASFNVRKTFMLTSLVLLIFYPHLTCCRSMDPGTYFSSLNSGGAEALARSPHPAAGILSRLQPGSDQSVPTSKLSAEAIEQLQAVFGLSQVPKGNRRKRSAPQHMIELYSYVADEGGVTTKRGPYDSDVIRSFPDRAFISSMHYYYNVTPFISQHDETVQEAELRLFRIAPTLSDQAVPRSRILQLSVWQVTDPAAISTADTTIAAQGLRLIDRERIPAHHHGWQVFSVKSAVNDWLRAPSTNYGLLITTSWVGTADSTPAPPPLSGAKPDAASPVRFMQRGQHHDHRQPALIVYTEAEDRKRRRLEGMVDLPRLEIGEMNPHRVSVDVATKPASPERPNLNFLREGRRAAKSRGKRSAGKNNNIIEKQNNGNGKRLSKGSCQRRDLYVDFEEIGWSGWIISPKGYNAYHCQGACNFPLGQSQRPTNHATVQSIVHALRIVAQRDLQKPCCVPNKLQPISLLYFDSDENVILKQYDDMVANSCGCH